MDEVMRAVTRAKVDRHQKVPGVGRLAPVPLPKLWNAVALPGPRAPGAQSATVHTGLVEVERPTSAAVGLRSAVPQRGRVAMTLPKEPDPTAVVPLLPTPLLTAEAGQGLNRQLARALPQAWQAD